MLRMEIALVLVLGFVAYMEKQTGVTFADVAGQDEAKESLVEIA